MSPSPCGGDRGAVWPIEGEITSEEDVERLAWSNDERGQYIEPPPCALERHLAHRLPQCACGHLPRRWGCIECGLLRLRQLHAGRQRRRQQGGPIDATVVVIDLVVQPHLA